MYIIIYMYIQYLDFSIIDCFPCMGIIDVLKMFVFPGWIRKLIGDLVRLVQLDRLFGEGGLHVDYSRRVTTSVHSTQTK